MILLLSGCGSPSPDPDTSSPTHSPTDTPIEEAECSPAPEVVYDYLPVSHEEIVEFMAPLRPEDACLGIDDPDCLTAAQRLQDVYTETLESVLPSGMTRMDFEEGHVSYSLFRDDGDNLQIFFGEEQFEFTADSVDEEECPIYNRLESLNKEAFYLQTNWRSELEVSENTVVVWNGHQFDHFDAKHVTNRRLVVCADTPHVIENGNVLLNSLSYYLSADTDSDSQHYAIGLHSSWMPGCDDLENPMTDDAMQNYDCDVTQTCGQSAAIQEFYNKAKDQVLLLDALEIYVIYRHQPKLVIAI